MATKSTALRNAAVTRKVENLDSIDIKDGSDNVIATGSLSWGTAANGAIGLSGNATVTGTAAAGAGTNAATARIYDSEASGEEYDALTVTATGGGGNVQLNNISIAENQVVTITSATITESATTA